MLLARRMSSCRTGTRLSVVAALVALGMALATSGCTSGGGGPSCSDDKCDSAGDFMSKLEGRADPIAEFLRGSDVDAEGLMEGDYETFLFGVAEKMGCAADSVMTFALSDNLLMDEPFPRLISVACSNDDVKASDFFIAASFMDQETGDVDVHDVELFAWDATSRQYRFYAFKPAESDASKVEVEVEPKRCQQCHLTPSDQVPTGMPMTPIMNEINRPWTHWNAEPGFTSFDYELPSNMAAKPNFTEMMAHKGPASRFEKIIADGGHLKVAQARLRGRRDPTNLDQVMNLLRPVFCSEQINYVSEDFNSGVVFNAAVIDPGIRNMYKAIRPDNWSWGWVNGDTMRLTPPTGDGALTQIPVRGNADIITEQQLVGLRALTPHQVLRVRAIDWKKPVFSEFRCGLWNGAVERFRSEPPSLTGLTSNAAALPVVFEAIMAIDGNRLHSGQDDRTVAIADASPETVEVLIQRLGDGTLADATCEADGFCVADVDQLGGMIDQYVQDFENAADPRPALINERARRICEVLEPVESQDDRFESDPIRFENRPALPVECN
jgi:hypothetical protein